MKLADILTENDLRKVLEEIEQPETRRPPKAKGSDAIKVSAYVVRGHWRRRWYPAKPPNLNGRRR